MSKIPENRKDINMKDYFEAFRFKIAPLLNRRTVTAR
jgi:hypothetical protein